MRLYVMLKRDFVLLFAGLCAMVCLSTFIGLAGPPVTLTTQQVPSRNNTNHPRGPFSMKTPAVASYSQQLWVIGQIFTNNIDDEIFDKTFHVTVEVEGVNHDHKPVLLVRADSLHNRTRHIRCKQSTCEEFPILHLGFLEFVHYIITVQFHGLESFDQRYHIKDIMFYFKTYNPAFTELEIWFRFIFMLIAFIFTCWFDHSLSRFSVHDWSLEQRWMTVLLPLLILFNDPIFPMSLLFNSSVPAILDAIFQTSFLAGLMFFWLCAYHGIRQIERRFVTFYLPKLIIVFPIWLATVMTAAHQKTDELDDPTFNYEEQTENFHSLKVFYIVASSTYVLYMLLLILRAYSDLRSMPFFESRLRFLSTMMVVIVGVFVLLALFKFSIGIVQDNFVADLKTTYTTSGEFMALYGVINFSLYAMAYVYSPAYSTPAEAQITKDNPAFSMINDSDEDVIYGSDEDSRQPLNRSCNHDDSD